MPNKTNEDKLIAKLHKLATIELTCEPEDCRIEGNASAIDPETDKATVDWIRAQLESGNEWAWCCAHVRASFGGFHGDDYLGCCSYESRAEFMAPDGYYPDMVDEALRALASAIKDAGRTIKELEREEE